MPFDVLEENLHNYTVLQLLEMGLNYVHEAAHIVYVKHVYNGTVAETFHGDELFGADRTIPVEDRVDSAVKRVQKLSSAARAAVGQSSRGGAGSGTRGGGGRRGGRSFNGGRQQYRQNFAFDPSASGPPPFQRFPQTPGFFPGNGGGRGSGGGACFICGSPGHQARNCPRA